MSRLTVGGVGGVGGGIGLCDGKVDFVRLDCTVLAWWRRVSVTVVGCCCCGLLLWLAVDSKRHHHSPRKLLRPRSFPDFSCGWPGQVHVRDLAGGLRRGVCQHLWFRWCVCVLARAVALCSSLCCFEVDVLPAAHSLCRGRHCSPNRGRHVGHHRNQPGVRLCMAG